MDHRTLLARYAALTGRAIGTLLAAFERAARAAPDLGLSLTRERRDVGGTWCSTRPC
jgi:hypothetical protein